MKKTLYHDTSAGHINNFDNNGNRADKQIQGVSGSNITMENNVLQVLVNEVLANGQTGGGGSNGQFQGVMKSDGRGNFNMECVYDGGKIKQLRAAHGRAVKAEAELVKVHERAVKAEAELVRAHERAARAEAELAKANDELAKAHERAPLSEAKLVQTRERAPLRGTKMKAAFSQNHISNSLMEASNDSSSDYTKYRRMDHTRWFSDDTEEDAEEDE